MNENTSSCVSKLTWEFFNHKRFTREKITKWPSPRPDLNLIENPWTIVKMKLYEGGKKYKSKADLWEAIKSTILENEPAEVLNYELLFRSVTILKCKGLKDLTCVLYLFYYRYWSIFENFITFFIETICDYLVLPINFLGQFFRIHQITWITSIKLIDTTKNLDFILTFRLIV